MNSWSWLQKAATKVKLPVWCVRVIAVLLPLTCLWAFAPWLVGCAWLTPLPATVQQQVDKAMDYKLDGIIVYVDKKGQAPQFHAAGWKDREHKIPADPHALFKIASISKLYIAAATAKLVGHQRLSLDKTLAEYLPELAERIENSGQITLRMLLRHRSGIPNYVDDPEFSWTGVPASRDGFLDYVLDRPADFDPGTRYSYSNANYLLIGMILDRTLGYDHQQYIRKNILAPLGLTHTYGSLAEVDSGELVSGYDMGSPADWKAQNYLAPGGSMIATAQDVGIFLRALNDGSLFNADEQAIYSSVYVYEHTGLLPGYSSFATYYKDIDTVVIQFVNTSGGNSWPLSKIVHDRIARILRSSGRDAHG